MAGLPLAGRENPCLRKKAEKVEEVTPEIRNLIRDMAQTMYDAPGVGLAAPQVGVCKSIAVVDVGDGLIVLINPEILEAGGEEVDTEGCLSVPGLMGEVKRAAWVKVRAMNKNGREFEMQAEGYLARAFQHEIDHLNGTLFIDRADPLSLRRRQDGE